jgi:hypothetical protein
VSLGMASAIDCNFGRQNSKSVQYRGLGAVFDTQAKLCRDIIPVAGPWLARTVTLGPTPALRCKISAMALMNDVTPLRLDYETSYAALFGRAAVTGFEPSKVSGHFHHKSLRIWGAESGSREGACAVA